MRTLLWLGAMVLLFGCGGRSQSAGGKPSTGAGGAGTLAGSGNGSGADQGGAGGASGIADAGQGGAGGVPPDEAGGAGVSGPTAFRLSDQRVASFEVTADRSCHALVIWDEGTDTGSASFSAGRGEWSERVGLGARGVHLVASATGAFPVATWGEVSSSDSKLAVVSARRFDFERETWTSSAALPIESWPNDWQMVVDAAGDLLAFWRNPEGNYFSRWPLGGVGWEPALTVDEGGELVAGTQSSFLWSDRDTLLVQTFDAASANWSDAVALRDLTQESSLRSHSLVAGREDTALMLSDRRDSDAIVIEAWRKKPSRNEWSDAELVMTLPTNGASNILFGPVGALPDPSGDLVWAPFVTEAGDFELDVARYDPMRASWSLSRAMTGLSSELELDFELFADDAGRAYGDGNVGLTRFDRATLVWNDTMDTHARSVLPSTRGAFAFGAYDEAPVALKSEAGAEWRQARGLPSGTKGISYHGSRGALLEPERAVVVWSQDYGAEQGVWAAIVE